MVVNYYDHICAGYNYGMYKKDLFEKYAGTCIVHGFKNYKHFIMLSRKEKRVHGEEWKEFEKAAGLIEKNL